MASRFQRKRASKRLLVAAMGVATVSYVSTQTGCAPEGDVPDGDPGDTAPYDDEAPVVDVTEQALTNTGAAASAAGATGVSIQTPPKVRIPPVGNLMAPPPPVGNLMAPPPPPVGNLMAPPPVGNLMAPPPVVVQPPVVAEPVLPPVGNLMPPPKEETE